MASKSSIVPAVVWNWIIEALATSEQADISTLIERCDNILKKILHELPAPMTKSEKWDLGSFLKHKRSSLPKCSLTKLKEAILDDNNPLFASLKERSNLVISNASEYTSPVNDDELPLNPSKDKNNIQENVLHDDNVPQETFTEGRNKRVSVDSMENLEFVVKSKEKNKFQENMLLDDIVPRETYTGHNKRASVDSMGNLEFVVKTKDSDILQPNNEKADDDERTDIVAKKEAFLKSQRATGQDSLNLTEWSEIDLCMKCNESGELLLCSSDSCLLRFHVSCLGPTVRFEENGNFFCPFCAYSRAISKYQEAKRNASLAKKNLQAFSNFTVKPRPNEPSTKPSELEENEDIQMGDNINCMSNDKESRRSSNVNCMSNDKESQRSTNADCMSNDKESQRSIDVNDNEETTELPQNPIPQPTNQKQKCKEKESRRSTESSLTIRPRKRKAKHSPPPPVPSLRRRKLPWTKSEVEMLKEGVEKYSSGNNKKIPWKEILDFGHNVFNKGRTAIDLKDKWRNIPNEAHSVCIKSCFLY